MSASESCSGFIERLAADFRSRLNELDTERAAILSALKALEPARRPAPRAANLEQRVLERLTSAPGSRGSLVALELGVSTATVSDELARLENAGIVARVGLGWVATKPDARRTAARRPD